jgi:hypothetical protein
MSFQEFLPTIFFDKIYFYNFAKEKNLSISIIDEDEMNLPYYSSAK